jgi:type III secretion protein U
MSGDTTEEKKHKASMRKLRKLREDGQVPQTTKMVTLGITAVGLGAMIALLPGIYGTLSQYFDSTFRQMTAPLSQVRGPMLAELVTTFFSAVALLIGILFVTAILLPMIFHKGIPFSVTPLIPDFNRLNPAAGLTRLIDKRGLIGCGIGIVEIAIWVGLAWLILNGMLRPMLAIHACGLTCAGAVAASLGYSLVYTAIGLCVVMLAVDVLLQQSLYADEQRMTETERKQESKEQFGSPETRRARSSQREEARKEGEALASFSGVDRANMCFFTATSAVAIRYHPKSAPLPRVTVVAVGARAALDLRKAVAANGFKELENAEITNGCLRVRPGMGVPDHVFQDLVRGMRKLFG